MASAHTIKRNPELRELKCFIMDSKYACTLLQREIIFLSSKVVYDTNILEKIIWNKGSQCFYLQDVQNYGRPMKNGSQLWHQYKAKGN